MNFLTAEQVGGIARAVLAAVGGYLVGNGVVDAETVQVISGAATTIIVAVWSVWAKKQA